jgi:hypothetical protein
MYNETYLYDKPLKSNEREGLEKKLLEKIN